MHVFFLCENIDALDFSICRKIIIITILYVTTELILLHRIVPRLLNQY